MSAPVWKSMSPKAYHAYRKRAKSAKALYDAALRCKYKPNGKSEEIIGLQSATFTHITTDAVPGTLTQTTFDTTSRADSAQILMTNSTGSSKVIISAWIRGKPVTRRSGSKRPGLTSAGGTYKEGRSLVLGGYVHDKYVDYEAQARDGDITFETGNNFTVTADQVNKLADYYWKLNKTKKHIYTLSLVGFQSWYEPGEWYDLTIGGAGEAEYIDSTVECFDVRCSIAVGGAPYTTVSFREVEEDWKFDSNETARLIASGGFNRRPSQTVVTVAAQYYNGYADRYCDGTNDQEEINSAINYLADGGDIKLTRGKYYITSSISLSDNINLYGDGAGTILYHNHASGINMISAIGSAGSNIINVGISNIAMDYNQIGVDSCYVNLNYVDGYSIYNVVALNHAVTTFKIQETKNGNIINNTIKNDNATTLTVGDVVVGIYYINTATSYNNIVQGNIITGMRADGDLLFGMGFDDTVSEHAMVISNNQVHDCGGSSLTNGGAGISITLNRGMVSSNQITQFKTASAIFQIGLYITSSSTSCLVANNYCYNNGEDVGLANTNQDNFFDDGTDTQWAG